jgi:hypothetical protein
MARKQGQKSDRQNRAVPLRTDPLPKLANLHKSHFGVTKEVARSYAQAADVCFDRHHKSPLDLSVKTTGRSIQLRHRWRLSDITSNAATDYRIKCHHVRYTLSGRSFST